jgi:cyclophilin family peptidyl-prolyl cis-trans isomerase
MWWLLIILFHVVGASEQQVRCETTAGEFTIELHRGWAPNGHDRFVELVDAGFFDDQIIYRVLPGHAVHFGIAPDPAVQALWQTSTIEDDPPRQIPFTKGTVSFLGNSPLPNSRSTHILISDEPHGASMGNAHHERPIGRIRDASESSLFLQSCYSEYGDTNHLKVALTKRGNSAAAKFPELSRIETCYLVQPIGQPSAKADATTTDQNRSRNRRVCEVCIGVLNRVGVLLDSPSRRNQNEVESAIRRFCSKKTPQQKGEPDRAPQHEKMVRFPPTLLPTNSVCLGLISLVFSFVVLLLRVDGTSHCTPLLHWSARREGVRQD